MQSKLQEKIKQLIRDKQKRRKFLVLLLILSMFVSSGVFWALHLQGIALTEDSLVKQEENENSASGSESPGSSAGLKSTAGEDTAEEEDTAEGSNQSLTSQTVESSQAPQETSSQQSSETTVTQTTPTSTASTEATPSSSESTTTSTTAATEPSEGGISSQPSEETSQTQTTPSTSESSSAPASSTRDTTESTEPTQTEQATDTSSEENSASSLLKTLPIYGIMEGVYQLLAEVDLQETDQMLLGQDLYVRAGALESDLKTLRFEASSLDPRQWASMPLEDFKALQAGELTPQAGLQVLPILEYEGQIWLQALADQTAQGLLYLPRGLRNQAAYEQALPPLAELDQEIQLRLAQPSQEERFLQSPLDTSSEDSDLLPDLTDPVFLQAQSLLLLDFEDPSNLVPDLPEDIYLPFSLESDPVTWDLDLPNPAGMVWQAESGDGRLIVGPPALGEATEAVSQDSENTDLTAEELTFVRQEEGILLSIRELSQAYRIQPLAASTGEEPEQEVPALPLYAIINQQYEEITRLELAAEDYYREEGQVFLRAGLVSETLQSLGFPAPQLQAGSLAFAPLSVASALKQGEGGHSLQALPLREAPDQAWFQLTAGEAPLALIYLPRGLTDVAPEASAISPLPDALDPAFLLAQSFVPIRFMNEVGAPLELPSDRYALISLEGDPQSFQITLPLTPEIGWLAEGADGSVAHSPVLPDSTSELASVGAGLLENLTENLVENSQENTEAYADTELVESLEDGSITTQNEAETNAEQGASFRLLDRERGQDQYLTELSIPEIQQAYTVSLVNAPQLGEKESTRGTIPSGFTSNPQKFETCWYVIEDLELRQVAKTNESLINLEQGKNFYYVSINDAETTTVDAANTTNPENPVFLKLNDAFKPYNSGNPVHFTGLNFLNERNAKVLENPYDTERDFSMAALRTRNKPLTNTYYVSRSLFEPQDLGTAEAIMVADLSLISGGNKFGHLMIYAPGIRKRISSSPVGGLLNEPLIRISYLVDTENAQYSADSSVESRFWTINLGELNEKQDIYRALTDQVLPSHPDIRQGALSSPSKLDVQYKPNTPISGSSEGIQWYVFGRAPQNISHPEDPNPSEDEYIPVQFIPPGENTDYPNGYFTFEIDHAIDRPYRIYPRGVMFSVRVGGEDNTNLQEDASGQFVDLTHISGYQVDPLKEVQFEAGNNSSVQYTYGVNRDVGLQRGRRDIDANIRSLATLEVGTALPALENLHLGDNKSPIKILDFPDDEAILEEIRTGENRKIDVLLLDGTKKPVASNQLNSDDYRINWFLVTNEKEGWRVKGQIMPRTGSLRVQKTFSGDPQIIGKMITSQAFSITLTPSDPTVGTGTIELKLNTDTPANDLSNTYSQLSVSTEVTGNSFAWILKGLPYGVSFDLSESGEKYTLGNSTIEPNKEIMLQNPSPHSLSASADLSSWTAYEGEGPSIVVDLEADDTNTSTWQTVHFRNSYQDSDRVDLLVRTLDTETQLPMDDEAMEDDGIVMFLQKHNPVQKTWVDFPYYWDTDNIYDMYKGTYSSSQLRIYPFNGEFILRNLEPNTKYRLVEEGYIPGYNSYTSGIVFQTQTNGDLSIEAPADGRVEYSPSPIKVLDIFYSPITVEITINKVWEGLGGVENKKPVVVHLTANDYRASDNISLDANNEDENGNWSKKLGSFPLFREGVALNYSAQEDFIDDVASSGDPGGGFATYEVTVETLYDNFLWNSPKSDPYVWDENNYSYAEEAIITVTNRPKAGTLKFTKIDDYYGAPLAGVEFGLFEDQACTKAVMKENNVEQTATSSGQGEVLFSGLENGIYYLKELSTLPKYQLNEQVFEVRVLTDGSLVYELGGTEPLDFITNARKARLILDTVVSNPDLGDFSLHESTNGFRFQLEKLDNDGNFQIISNENNYILETHDLSSEFVRENPQYTNDFQGKFVINNLEEGHYRLSEIKVPSSPDGLILGNKDYYEFTVRPTPSNDYLAGIHEANNPWSSKGTYLMEDKPISPELSDPRVKYLYIVHDLITEGAELPATGGPGRQTYIYTGLAIMATAFFTALFAKKRQREGGRTSSRN